MSVTVVLRVRATPSDWGSSLCVVGNLPALSSWGSSSPLPLHAAGDLFTRTLSLPADTDIEYKYVLVDTAKVIRWEPQTGLNRRLFTGREGATILIDDGVFGSDDHVRVSRVERQDDRSKPRLPQDGNEERSAEEDGPSEEDEELQKGQPSLFVQDKLEPFVDSTAETIALADELDAARTHVESVRSVLRSLRGISPPPSVDEEAALPPSAQQQPPSGDADIATQLVQRCVVDGAVLVRTLHMKLDGGKCIKRRVHQPGAHALAVGSVAACVVLVVALVLISPQIAREARRRVTDVGDVVRGTLGEKGWQEALAMFWKRVKDGLEKAKDEMCEKTGWPRICGEKKMPVVKVIEAEVVGLTRGFVAWVEDTVRAVTGRRKPTPAETAWMTLPRSLRKLFGALD